MHESTETAHLTTAEWGMLRRGSGEQVKRWFAARMAQAKAEALRSQRDFFAAIDMPGAADHCEQAAIAYDHSRTIALDVRTPPGEASGV